MDVLDVVREWNIRCAQCGDCKAFKTLFLPSCPSGHRFKFNSYFATGRLMIGRGLKEGVLALEDDDVIDRLYTCTVCRACDENCGNFPGGHIVDVIEGLRQMAVSAGCLLPAHQVMVDSLKKNDNVLERPREERGDWARGLGLKDITAGRAEVVYRAGCLLSFDPEMQGVARDAVALLRRAGVDVAVGQAGEPDVALGVAAAEVS